MTTTLATQPGTAVADLVLVRMSLPSKKPPAPSAVREDVGKLLDAGLSAAEFDDLRSELASAGFLTKGKRNSYAITDAGRERSLQFLGITEIPPRTNWSTVIAKYLYAFRQFHAPLEIYGELQTVLIVSMSSRTAHRLLTASSCNAS